jgi:hypothetical protein
MQSRLSGNLVITMRFEIPVNEDMYPLIKEQGEVTVADIIAAEEANYFANVDNYLDLVGDHIVEVDISFRERKENNERPSYDR